MEPQALLYTLGTATGSDKWTTRTRRVIRAYAAGQAIYTLARQVKDRRSYTVAVMGRDDIYHDVLSWLLTLIPERRRRGVVARSVINPETADIRILYDGARTQHVTIDGHKVRVEVERPQPLSIASLMGDDDRPDPWTRERIVFTAPTLAGREAVVAFLTTLADAKKTQPSRLYVASTWGDWRRVQDTPPRTFESVVLRAGLKESLVADLDAFMAMEETYAVFGLPWHRGFLFHGPPGTGKTSAAKALAAWYGLDVHYIPLAAVKDDNTLLALMAAITPRSMLLLEDIDIVHGTRTRDDTEPGVTLSGLLNALDGLLTPHGLLTVMTTNDPTDLDPALVRPGRVDRSIEFPYLDHDQLTRLGLLLTRGGPFRVPPQAPSADLAPADVLEAVKAHLDDPEEVGRRIVELTQ